MLSPLSKHCPTLHAVLCALCRGLSPCDAPEARNNQVDKGRHSVQLHAIQQDDTTSSLPAMQFCALLQNMLTPRCVTSNHPGQKQISSRRITAQLSQWGAFASHKLQAARHRILKPSSPAAAACRLRCTMVLVGCQYVWTPSGRRNGMAAVGRSLNRSAIRCDHSKP